MMTCRERKTFVDPEKMWERNLCVASWRVQRNNESFFVVCVCVREQETCESDKKCL